MEGESLPILIAKIHKIAERVGHPGRLNDKDAHDVYRILRAIETDELVTACTGLLRQEICVDVVSEALQQLTDLFAAGPAALGSEMAGRAEEGVGEPEQTAVAVSVLARDLTDRLPVG